MGKGQDSRTEKNVNELNQKYSSYSVVTCCSVYHSMYIVPYNKPSSFFCKGSLCFFVLIV